MKEDLMFGCLGNGITVADRNRMYLGDYATVAHISGEGLVRIYCQFLSEEALDSIHNMARNETEKAFKRWQGWSEGARVSVMDRELYYQSFMELFKKHDLLNMSAEESFKLLRQAKVESSSYELPREERSAD